MKSKWLGVIICVSLLLLGMPSIVSAHANLERSTPLQDAVLQQSPEEIRIQFTEEVDSNLSQITLEDNNGNIIKGTLSTEAERWLIYKIPKLDEGIYKVKWQALSVDTHVTEGSFRFSIAVPLEKEKPSGTISLDDEDFVPIASDSGKINSEQKQTTASTSPNSAQPKSETTVDKANQKPATGTTKPIASSTPNITPNPSSQQDSQSQVTEPSTKESPGKSILDGETESSQDEESGELTKKDQDLDSANNQGNVSITDSNSTLDNFSDSETLNGSSDSASDEQIKNHAGNSIDMQNDEPSNSNDWRNAIYHLLRIAEVLIVIAVVGFIVFRYGILDSFHALRPALFSLRKERLLYATATLIGLAIGIIHVWILADQLSGIGSNTFIVTINTIITSTLIGNASWIRPTITVLMLGVTILPIKNKRSSFAMKAILALMIVILFPLTGHAFGSSTGIWYNSISNVLHILAAAIWFGGLIGIWAIIGRKNESVFAWASINALILRFSTMALPSLVIVAISGIILTLLRLNSWRELFYSNYGQLIVAKTILMLLVILIGAFHRLVLIPRMGSKSSDSDCDDKNDTRRFLLFVRLEIILAVVIFVLAGSLSTTAPPAKSIQVESINIEAMK